MESRVGKMTDCGWGGLRGKKRGVYLFFFLFVQGYVCVYVCGFLEFVTVMDATVITGHGRWGVFDTERCRARRDRRGGHDELVLGGDRDRREGVGGEMKCDVMWYK